jgi:hypothetical protein
MSARRAFLALAVASLAVASPLAPPLSSPTTAWAAPADAKPGDVRATYSKQGTVLRADASAIAAAVATLPARTSVTVVEAKLPWLRVKAPQGEGWLRAWETVEPQALTPSGPAAHLAGAGGGVDARDVSAAGRQFDAATEGRYRASRADLQRAYAHVDAMEAATQAMDPADTIAFIMEGSLGLRGRAYGRPARIPPSRAGPPDDGGGGGGGGADVVGGVLGGLFGKRGSDAAKVVKKLGKAAKFVQRLKTEFSPSQEYYLGRAVAANALARWGVEKNEAMRRHVRLVGDAIVRLTNRLPSNYGGYNFEVLDCPDVNGISGPGGFVLLTRGAVEACRTEDELAGIIGHELGHIRAGHGTQTLKRSKRFQAAADGAIALLGETDLGDNQFAEQLLNLFQEGVKELAGQAMEHSYGSALEHESDVEGTYFLVDVFYDHAGLRDVLRRMGQGHRHAGDAAHLPPEVRAQQLDRVVAGYPPFAPREGVKEARLARFGAMLGRR